MIKKISEKDKRDWENFTSKKEKLEDKDQILKNKHNKIDHMEIDLHGYSLDDANKKIFQFISECYEKNVKLQWDTENISKKGIIGNPLNASSSKGEKIVKTTVSTIEKIIKELKLL